MTLVKFASENNELADKYLLPPITNIRPSNMRAIPDGVNILLDKMKTFEQLDKIRERNCV